MNVSKLALAVGAFVVTAGMPVFAAPPPAAAPAAADQLVRVPGGQLQVLYLAPGADLSRVTSVIIDPTQVEFRENWVRDFNRTSRRARLTDARAEQIRTDVSSGMDTVFANAFRMGGFQVIPVARLGAQAPAGSVRIQAHVVNLAITAPDVQSASRLRTFADTAGEAALVLEVRDPGTNAVLARAIDRRIAGRSVTTIRNSVTNRSDFRLLFEHWARSAVEDLRALQAAAKARPR